MVSEFGQDPEPVQVARAGRAIAGVPAALDPGHPAVGQRTAEVALSDAVFAQLLDGEYGHLGEFGRKHVGIINDAERDRAGEKSICG